MELWNISGELLQGSWHVRHYSHCNFLMGVAQVINFALNSYESLLAWRKMSAVHCSV